MQDLPPDKAAYAMPKRPKCDAPFGAAYKAAQTYKKTGNLRAAQSLLGHTKLESTVRYLGIEADDAPSISEQIEL